MILQHIISVVVIFILGVVIFQATWNYALTRLARSLSRSYNPAKDFKKISFATALVALILIMITASSHIIWVQR